MKLTQKLLWTSLILTFLVSMTNINLALATPATYFWLDPPLLEGTPDGRFLINVKIEDAPNTYAWEIYLGWDPERLELVRFIEGSFLKRGIYPTAYAPYPIPYAEANLKGEIRVACSLIGNISQVPWANGDGLLATFGFIVQAPGAVHLDLFSTSLFDHVDSSGYPAPTSYDNEDALVDATNFYYAGLAGWRLKVNGKAGHGLGIKTTVGTPNLLEAFINNTGAFDVQVKAFFEIRDASGYWIATIGSAVAPVPAGETTVLSAYWTALGAGTYYVTAYSLYSAPPIVTTVTITDGFSRTLRLKAV